MSETQAWCRHCDGEIYVRHCGSRLGPRWVHKERDLLVCPVTVTYASPAEDQPMHVGMHAASH